MQTLHASQHSTAFGCIAQLSNLKPIYVNNHFLIIFFKMESSGHHLQELLMAGEEQSSAGSTCQFNAPRFSSGKFSQVFFQRAPYEAVH